MTIGPQLEQVQNGEGDFHDVVALHFSDGDAGLHGFLRVAREPGSGKTAVIGLLFGDDRLVTQVIEPVIDVELDSWERAEAGPATVAIEQPLRSWSAALEGDAGSFDVALEAITPPLDLADPQAGGVGAIAGVREYAQMCTVTGTVTIDGRQQEIKCSGWRGHVWGAPDWPSLASRRSVYFGSLDAGAVAILGGRPAGARGHDREVNGGVLVAADGEPQQLDEILLSTVYDDQRLPDSAGLELYLPGDEFARRMVGKAMFKTSMEAGGRTHNVCFFSWSLDDRAGWGTYQMVAPL